MKVKIFQVSGESSYCDSCENILNPLLQDITDWEEISDNDFWQIKSNLPKNMILVNEVPEQAKVIKTTIDKIIKEEERRRKLAEKQQKEYEKRKIENKKKRDLAKLEKLKAEYGDTNG